MIALIDGDIVLYNAGFAVDKRYYKVGSSTFYSANDAKNYIAVHGGEMELVREPSPPAYYFQAVNTKITSILDATQASDYMLFLSDDKNFRREKVTNINYKGTRNPDHKPLLLDEIKAYMFDTWQAQSREYLEADDCLGIYQSENDTIICTTDKDLNMIPGWHYNWNHKLSYHVNELEADTFFYTQLLMGDRVDNIPGLKGIGPKKAAKILQGSTTRKEMHETTRQAYIKAHQGDEEVAENWMQDNGTLLWILREEDVFFCAKEIP